jgi:LacI family transcriptional regulator
MNKNTRASSKDVAREAGVSQATVSYVLNNAAGIKVKPETREAVLLAAKKLNYHPNLIAKSMRLKKAMSIGIVSDKSISSFMFMNVLEGIKDALIPRNYTMTLCFNRSQEIEDAEHINYYRSNRIDGIIFAYADISQEHIDFLSEGNIPYVVIHTNIKAETKHLVKTDMSKSIFEAVSDMKNKREGTIGYMGRSVGNKDSPRFQGYISALEKCNLPMEDKLLINIPAGEENNLSYFDNYFNNLGYIPSAVLCDCANLAFSLFKYSAEKGIKIPQDMAVAAIGTSNFAPRSNPSLSAIEAPLYEMGYTGCNMLFDVMKSNSEGNVVVLDWKYVEREST